MADTLPYRPCVGIVLVNVDGLIFTAERIDTPGAWQMPQGGIDDGEAPADAAHRELAEETGVGSNMAEILDEHPDWLRYDLPNHLVGKVWRGRWRGQTQKWFLMRFDGPDAAIDLSAEDEEFGRWRWASSEAVRREIVPFKRPIYEAVLDHFADRLA